jgi:hypothetical protein
MELNGTHQLLFHEVGVKLLGENIHTMTKNAEAISDASKEVILQANADKTKHMLMSHHNVKQNHNKDS